MSSMSNYDSQRSKNHSWESAVGYLSSAPRRLDDGGLVQDASGWKVAKLCDPILGKFKGYAFGTYLLSDSAKCGKNRHHESPYAGCDCGFYAMKERHKALYLMERWRSLVLLKVELYGIIYEHSEGYRSQEQEVVSMGIASRCGRPWCKGVTAGMTKSRSIWRSACARHLEGDYVTLAKMRSAMALDVVLIDD